MDGGHEHETGPLLPLAMGSASLTVGVVVAILAQVPGVSGTLLTVAALLFGRAVWKLRRRRGSVDLATVGATSRTGGVRSPNRLAESVGHERQLLLAMRDNGGSITAAEATMSTALTVGEAERMLSRLTEGGHLTVKGEEGALVYALPARSLPNPTGRG